MLQTLPIEAWPTDSVFPGTCRVPLTTGDKCYFDAKLVTVLAYIVLLHMGQLVKVLVAVTGMVYLGGDLGKRFARGKASLPVLPQHSVFVWRFLSLGRDSHFAHDYHCKHEFRGAPRQSQNP